MMPLKKCQSKRKKGYKWGRSGKCYTGRSAKTKAKRQGRAISLSKARRKGHKIPRRR